MYIFELTLEKYFSKVSVFLRILEGDKIHTSLTTEITPVKPIPILE